MPCRFGGGSCLPSAGRVPPFPVTGARDTKSFPQSLGGEVTMQEAESAEEEPVLPGQLEQEWVKRDH